MFKFKDLKRLLFNEDRLFLYSIQDSKMSEEHWKKIHHCIKTVQEFYYISSNFKVDYEENIPKFIQNNPNFEILSIMIFEKIMDFDNQKLKLSLQNRKLKVISIYLSTPFNIDNILNSLENCEINILDLTGVHFKRIGSIQKIQNLKELNLYKCEFFEDISTGISFPVTHLRIENVIFLKKDIFYQFIQCFPKLKNLHLNIDGIDCKKLKNSLEEISLDEFSFIDLGYLTNEMFLKDILQGVQQEINVNESKDANVYFPLFSYLKDNKKLRKFSSHFRVHDPKDLDTFLLHNQEIQEFNMSITPKITFSNHVDLIKILGKGLSQNHSIKILSLSLNLENDFKILIKLFQENANITDLNLSYSFLNDESSQIIGDYLSKNKTLKSFKITDNNFTEKSLRPIFNGLIQNQSLKSFHLGIKSLSNKGCELLKELFTLNQTLKSIEIVADFVKFEDDGLKMLGEGLSWNSSLQNISLKCNIRFFSIESMTELQKNLFFNVNLVSFHFNSQISEYISPILQRNSRFIKTLKIDRKNFNNLKVNFH